ncbi:MAG: TfuA-like protein [Pseudonocardiaceae bacterium]
MPDVVVFLGPSLAADVAQRLLPSAKLLPPVQLGDVCAAVYQGADVIIVIDGFFEQVPTVWHKEILWALSRGIWVYGAASMGALRAAELAPFGMRGIGAIYERYASGDYTDDDEVMIVHAPADDGYRPLSVAMASLRDGLERAVAAGIIDQLAQVSLVAAAKQLHYADRSWFAVLAAAGELDLPDAQIQALRDFLRRARPDAKAEDAAAVLNAAARDLAGGFAPWKPDFEFEVTNSFEKLQRIVRAELAEDALIRRYGRSSAHLRKEMSNAHLPLFYLLVEAEAKRLGLSPGPVGGVVDEVAQRYGAATGAATQLVSLESLAAQLEKRHAKELAIFTDAALCGLTAPDGDWLRPVIVDD